MIKQVLILCTKLYIYIFFFFKIKATVMQPGVTLVVFGCLFSGSEWGFIQINIVVLAGIYLRSVLHQEWAVNEDMLTLYAENN